jgi:hypothetical protein
LLSNQIFVPTLSLAIIAGQLAPPLEGSMEYDLNVIGDRSAGINAAKAAHKRTIVEQENFAGTGCAREGCLHCWNYCAEKFVIATGCKPARPAPRRGVGQRQRCIDSLERATKASGCCGRGDFRQPGELTQKGLNRAT